MPTLTRTEKIAAKKTEKRIERCYYASCNGIAIDMMDIAKVFAAGKAAIEARPFITDAELSDAIRAFVELLRKN